VPAANSGPEHATAPAVGGAAVTDTVTTLGASTAPGVLSPVPGPQASQGAKAPVSAVAPSAGPASGNSYGTVPVATDHGAARAQAARPAGAAAAPSLLLMVGGVTLAPGSVLIVSRFVAKRAS
jgi:hypothetical protein